MFTIKIVHANGDMEGRACESYAKTAINGSKMPTITLTKRGEKEKIDLDAGDVAYIENSLGKTIDIVRTQRPPPP